MIAALILIGALFLMILLRYLIRKEEPDVVILDEDDTDYQVFRDTVTIIPIPPPVHTPTPAPAPQNDITMAQFQTAYAIVRKHEGGYQKMPEDSGNYNSLRQNVGTNFGINAQVYERYLGRPPSEQDMRSMPHHIALMLYKQIYWDRIKGDQIRDQQVANILFDGHVNHGGWGVKMMQQALGVSRDGAVGPVTLGAINAANGFKLFNAYKGIRRAGYIDLVRRRPKDKRFLNGWLRRIDSFIYQGGGLILPGVRPGPSSSGPAAPSGGSGVVVAVIAAVAAFMFLK